MIEVLHCGRDDPRAARTIPTCRATDLVRRGRAARRGRRRDRGAARHAHPPLPGRRERPGDHGNLIVSTTSNNEAMNRAVQEDRRRATSRASPRSPKGCSTTSRSAIRAYDPCLSCATHALGQMPLEVTLVDADGAPWSSGRGEGIVSAAAHADPRLGQPGPRRRRPRSGPRRRCSRPTPPFGLTVDSDYQLQVEDAAEVARHDRVLFVDADRAGEAPFRFRRLEPAAGVPSFTTHSVPPGELLALARRPVRRPTGGLADGHPGLRVRRVRRGAVGACPRQPRRRRRIRPRCDPRRRLPGVSFAGIRARRMRRAALSERSIMSEKKPLVLCIDDDPDVLALPRDRPRRRRLRVRGRGERRGRAARLPGGAARRRHRRPDDGGGRLRHRLRQGAARARQHARRSSC